MILLILLTLLFFVDLVIIYRLLWGLQHFTPPKVQFKQMATDDLPTVSVCIPARNEKHAMTDCLEAVVSSDYPKLEVIVLDDGSRDDTSLLIKSFAHAGVRFVEGKPLPEGWLGKNYALNTLLNEASGQYVLFMDVDTRLRSQTVSQLVSYILHHHIDMVSVMPRRHSGWRVSTVFATMRFFWEILWHRNSKPAAVSTTWMIKRSVLLDDLGGLDAYATDTRPDSVVARSVAKSGRYRFLISTPEIGVSYEKKWTSQFHTSVRLTFPALGSSWLRTFAAVAGLALTLLPYICMMMGFWSESESSLLVVVAWLIGLLQIVLYSWYVFKIWPRGWIPGGLVLPILLVIEIWIVFASAVRYTQKTVTWKGRPIATTVTATPKPSESAS